VACSSSSAGRWTRDISDVCPDNVEQPATVPLTLSNHPRGDGLSGAQSSGERKAAVPKNGGEPDLEDAPHGQIFLRAADRSNLFGVIVSDSKRAETRKMATKKKPGKRGWKQASSKPQSASLMERLAALPQQQANENERTGRTQPS
jgi:hypothetical protein